MKGRKKGNCNLDCFRSVSEDGWAPGGAGAGGGGAGGRLPDDQGGPGGGAQDRRPECRAALPGIHTSDKHTNKQTKTNKPTRKQTRKTKTKRQVVQIESNAGGQ